MTSPSAFRRKSTTDRTRLRPDARWVHVTEPPRQQVDQMARELLLPEAVCRLLVSRGFNEPEAARRFLRPRLEHLAEPDCLFDLPRAVDRIGHAIRGGETIFVHGDYDVDGMSSTALMTRVLRALGAVTVVPFVPNRLTDGYDLGPAGVLAARAAGATLVITCDCGTSAIEAVRELSTSGIDVIITDHHLPGGPLPQAFAICNPRRVECSSADKDLAAVGVAYKIALALCDAFGVSRNLAHRQLDLVALATIADVAPLRGENRVLVRYGLKLLAESDKPGIRSLIRSSGLEGKPLTAGRVGFVLAPRLNAAGRIGDAKLGLSLLLAEQEGEANAIARELEEMNRARQELDRDVCDQAMRMVDTPEMRDRWAFVVAREGWHAGVIGIVASRIVEETARPCVLVSLGDGVGKGSGRSIPRFDLHAALSDCRDLFQRFGGHRAAAGLTMSADLVPEFVERLDEVAHKRMSEDDLVPELRVDMEIPFDHVGDELEKVVRHFEPFGIGNPSPTFAASGVRLASNPRRIGADGMKLCFDQGLKTIDAIGWGMGNRISQFDVSREIDLVFRLERDEYRGESRLQLRIADARC